MKLKFSAILLLLSFSLAIGSCTSSRGGCKATQGYVGYGR